MSVPAPASWPLLPDPAEPELVVDLSNVCRDDSLGSAQRPASWTRLAVLAEAITGFLGHLPRAVCIADASLRNAFDRDDRRIFEDAEATGFVEVAERFADDELLNVCEEAGCLVLSNDQFRDHRRERSWIDGDEDHFLGWRVRDGDVEVFRRRMAVLGDATKSRFEEAVELKHAGIRPDRTTHRDVLTTVWRCENTGCMAAKLAPQGIPGLPVLRDGVPRCPACTDPLVPIGHRPRSRLVVLALEDREIARLPLPDGETRRLDGETALAVLPETHPALALLRGCPVEVGIDGDYLRVRIANGAEVEERSRQQMRPLPPGVARVGPRAEIVIARRLVIRLSGRRWPQVGAEKP